MNAGMKSFVLYPTRIQQRYIRLMAIIFLLLYSIFIILAMMFYSETNFLPPNYKVLQKLPWRVHFESSCGFCLVCLYARNILERDLCEQLFIII